MDNGLSTTGVDFVIFNNAINASGGSASISVNAPTQIEINSNLTGGTGGVSLVGGGSSTGDTDGVLILGSGTTITATASGNVSVTGSGGSGSGSANYGVFVQGSITSGGGNVSVTGQGGNAATSGGLNYGVNTEAGGVIKAGGSGTVTVVGPGVPAGEMARVVAGLQPDPAGFDPAARALFPAFARDVTAQWTSYREKIGLPMANWACAEIDSKEGETVFYPFSGPDLSSVNQLYPLAGRYIMVAMQRAGLPPEMIDIT